jgi:hypothetical protein
MTAEWMEDLARHDRVSIVPYQAPGIPHAHGLTSEACRRSVWAIDERGNTWSGASAVAISMCRPGIEPRTPGVRPATESEVQCGL